MIFLLLAYAPTLILLYYIYLVWKNRIELKAPLVIMFALIVIQLYVYLVIGSINIMPEPLGESEALYTVLAISAVVLPLFISRDRNTLILYSFLSLFSYCAISLVYTILAEPYLVPLRLVSLPFAQGVANSPGVVNTMILSSVILVYYYFKGWISISLIAISLVLSSVMLNRTGVILCIVILMIYMKKEYFVKKVNANTLSFSLLVIGMILSFILYNIYLFEPVIERLRIDGLGTGRWVNQLDGLNAILNLDMPNGGIQVRMDHTLWFHNVLIDAYRVSGLTGLVSSILPLLFLAIYMTYKNKSKYDYVLLILFMLVVMSSIPIEGGAYERFAMIIFTARMMS